MIFSLLEWLNASWIGQAAQSPELEWFFILVQSVHILSLTIIGGTVLLADMRLLGWILTDVSSNRISDAAHRWFSWALCAIIITGIYELSAIYSKAYYNFAFRAKMAGLLAGIIFVYAIRRPLLKRDHNDIRPWLLKTMASASIALWFTVACSGRWIGFS